MTPNSKEWILNGVLLAGIAGFLVLIGVTGARDTGVPRPVIEESGVKVLPPDLGESSGRPDVSSPPVDDQFPYIGKTEFIRVLITPTPTPPTPTPTPVPTPSLERVSRNWKYQYPIARKGSFAFIDTRTQQEFWIKSTEPTEFEDPDLRQRMGVTAKPLGKTQVRVEGAGQHRDFSLDGKIERQP